MQDLWHFIVLLTSTSKVKFKSSLDEKLLHLYRIGTSISKSISNGILGSNFGYSTPISFNRSVLALA